VRIEGCLRKLKSYIVQDIEQRFRSNALAEGDDDLEMLKELVELSNQRRIYTKKAY
jgi:hypothetical protein